LLQLLKVKNSSLLFLFLLGLSAFSYAQISNQTILIPDPNLSKQKSKAEDPKKLKPIPIVVEESPWILNLLSFVDLYQKPSTNKQWEEINFGYQFSEQTSLYLDWGYNGLLQPQNATDAEIWDPELILGFKIPLSLSKNNSDWYLLVGTSLLLPASLDSVKNGLLAGFSAYLGFQWERGPWTLISKNMAYVFAYQFQPVTLPDNPSGDTGDNQMQVNAQSSNLTYVTTLQMLRLTYKFNEKVSAKLETWYNMFFSGGVIPTETVQLISTVGYFFTPQFRVFSGFTTGTEVDKGAGPSLMTAASTGLRLGFYLKW